MVPCVPGLCQLYATLETVASHAGAMKGQPENKSLLPEETAPRE